MCAGQVLDRSAIYRGDIVVFRQLQPMVELCSLGEV
eukprot:SAG31_NODE_29871_length_388_cov_1.612457_1_plen_35_part_10